MAHNILERDSLFTVRVPAWHGLGVTLDDYPTRVEAQKIAHPWEPIAEPIYTKEPGFALHTHTEDCNVEECDLIEDLTETFEKVDGFAAIKRSDNGATLGVVTDTYEPVTNTEMWDIAEAIQGPAVDVKFETAGSLKGGSKVWLLLRLNEPIVLNGDSATATIPYYALQNAHDGSGSFRGQATMTRIVCDNTAQVADLDARARGTEFVFRHTKNVGDRIEQAKVALAGWRNSIEEWRQISEMLCNAPVDAADVTEFLNRYIPIPPEGAASDRVRRNAFDAQATWHRIYASQNMAGTTFTAYGLIQTSIEYAQHYRRANSAESKFRRAYLDRSDVVASAVKIARDVAHV